MRDGERGKSKLQVVKMLLENNMSVASFGPGSTLFYLLPARRLQSLEHRFGRTRVQIHLSGAHIAEE